MGLGQRFKDVGYSTPKPLIKAFGKEVLFWLLDDIDCKSNNVVIVCRTDNENARFSERLRSRYHDNVSVLFVSENTLGAADTLRIALNSGLVDVNEPFAVCDSDTFYAKSHIEQMKSGKNSIFYFEDTGSTPIYSYVKIIEGKVSQIAEKKKISDHASVGTYCFESGKIALKHIENVIRNKKATNGEFYVSAIFQSMIDAGETIHAEKVSEFTCLGTPAQLQGFQCKKQLRFCFDIDNTLVSFPKIPGDYSSVEPIHKNIDFLRYLKSGGHTIILQTARRMQTHAGNEGKVLADIGKITFETLEKFEIPFDEIHFGKPNADFYIDDKAVDAYGDLERLTGVYQNEMISRDHNHLTTHSDVVIKVSSKDAIKGELYWYLNSPQEVKHLFPKLINFQKSDEKITLELERINGPTLSKMLTLGTMRLSHVNDLLDCLNAVHETSIENEEVDIYSNYLQKLDQRYFAFEDSKNKESEEIYKRIKRFLSFYELEKLAVRSNVHGDPVFTNVIVDKNNRLKLIDMRGMQGETFTMTGDKNYDYAKIYQSLVGYDFLIRKMQIDEQKLQPLRQKFLGKIDIDQKILSGLTASLLFTCIPLQPSSIRNELLRLSKSCISLCEEQT